MNTGKLQFIELKCFITRWNTLAFTMRGDKPEVFALFKDGRYVHTLERMNGVRWN